MPIPSPSSSPLDPNPGDPDGLLSPAQARRLLDDARGLASGRRPVEALQALLSALAALGAPREALQVFGRAVEALTLRGGEGGGGAEQQGEERQQPGAAAAPSLDSLLSSLSLEATARLGALEQGGGGEGSSGMALDNNDGGGGGTQPPTPALPTLLSEEAAAAAAGASVRCGECGAVVAATRAEAHALFWCSSLGGGGGGG